MSDYIDEIERIIKRNSFQLKHGQNVHYLRANAAVEEVARAVAERVKAEMREERDRRAQMAHDLLIALAKRRLVDANNECEVGAWPNGQEWDELSQSSRDVFKHEAREEAGVDHAAYIKPLREGTIHVVEHD